MIASNHMVKTNQKKWGGEEEEEGTLKERERDKLHYCKIPKPRQIVSSLDGCCALQNAHCNRPVSYSLLLFLIHFEHSLLNVTRKCKHRKSRMLHNNRSAFETWLHDSIASKTSSIPWVHFQFFFSLLFCFFLCFLLFSHSFIVAFSLKTNFSHCFRNLLTAETVSPDIYFEVFIQFRSTKFIVLLNQNGMENTSKFWSIIFDFKEENLKR